MTKKTSVKAAAKLVAALIVAWTAGCGISEAKTVRVIPGRMEVVVAPDAPKASRYAADELAEYLGKAASVAVPVVTAPTPGKYTVYVGTNAWSAAANLDPTPLRDDSYIIRIARDCAYILGCDDPKVDVAAVLGRGAFPRCRRASEFGVKGFLEKFVGVRFYFPCEEGVVVPSAPYFDLPLGDTVVEPRFARRDCYIHSCGYPGFKHGSQEESAARARYRFFMREETHNGVPCCHGQNAFDGTKRFGETHPEYFTLRKSGKRIIGDKGLARNQYCQSSRIWEDVIIPETIKRIRKGEKCVDLMPNDGMSACHCPDCLKAYGTTNLVYTQGFASELVWGRTAQAANAVKAAGLDGCVSQMAYGCYSRIPEKAALPDNVKVVLAVGGPWASSNKEHFDYQTGLIRSWSEKLGGPVAWVWTYTMKNYGRLTAKNVPAWAPRAYAKFYSAVAPYIDGSFIEADRTENLVQQYLNFYVFNRIAWDGAVDVEALVAEHNRLMFGAAAPQMTKLLDGFEETWMKATIPSLIPETEMPGHLIDAPSEYEIWTKHYTPAKIASWDRLLSDAAAAVPAGSAEAKRVAWIRRELFEPMAAESARYMASIPVEKERERRAKAGDANVVYETKGDWSGWSHPDFAKVDGTAFRFDGRGFGGFWRSSMRLDGARALKPGAKYRVSLFVKTEKLEVGYGCGACVEINGKNGFYVEMPGYCKWRHDTDWIAQSQEFTTPKDLPPDGQLLQVGIWRGTGSAWFDELRIEEVKE